MFSGLNNLEFITILDNLYANKFGFTEDEVKWLSEKSGSELTIQEIRDRYNGYNNILINQILHKQKCDIPLKE